MTITVGSLLEIVLVVGVFVVGGIIVRAYLEWRKEHTGS